MRKADPKESRMSDASLVRTSKFLSLVLRHKPEAIGLTLDPEGWADVDELIALAGREGRSLSRGLIARVVATNDKQRFALSPDGSKIRANQGHSVDIDPGLAPVVPPDILFHGTATRFLDSIRAQGLIPGSRLHVHLSADEATALKVGRRHGRPVVLTVRSGAMHAAGMAFYRSENGVWLTDRVPAEFLEIPS
jgi:putative RNA 2'-phosphotransferase